MSSVLESERVVRTLSELRTIGVREDALYRERIQAREAELGAPLYGWERAEIGADAPLAISPDVGQVLYALVLSLRPSLIVEFGTSLGISTIYLASALAELGAGTLITTELVPPKAAQARSALAAAGLIDWVECRVGDALVTLADIDCVVDLLFLDGSNDLYLPVLELLERRLAPAAVIVADMSAGDPHHEHYRQHVSDPENGLTSAEIDLGAGLVVSTPRPLA